MFHHVSRHLSDRAKPKRHRRGTCSRFATCATLDLGGTTVDVVAGARQRRDALGRRLHLDAECRRRRAASREPARRRSSRRGLGELFGVDRPSGAGPGRKHGGRVEGGVRLDGRRGRPRALCGRRAPRRRRSASIAFRSRGRIVGFPPGEQVSWAIMPMDETTIGGSTRWRAPSRSSACWRSRRRPSSAAVRPPEAAVRDHDAAERPDGRARRGSLDADRSPAAHVSRRLEEREAGPHRLCASVRAPDVQGLEERRARRPHVDDRVGRRSEQRLHDRRRDRVLGNGAVAVPADRCCGSRPIAWRRCASTRTRSPTSATS